MSRYTLDPPDDAVESVRQRWREETDTFGRVYDVVLAITEPTASAEVADLADCSPNAAKKHLERLVEMGIVRASESGRGKRFQRDDGFLEWREASRIAKEMAIDDIVERVRHLEERRDSYEARFDTANPADVSVFDLQDHEAIHDRMADVSDWHGIDRDIRLYELARQIAQNDGHLLPA